MITTRPFSIAITHSLPQVVLTIALLLLTAHCSLLTVAAQSATATLSGTVEDQNGAVIPGVSITLTNTANGQQREATTGDNGSYTIPLLSPGTYVLRAERQGFAPIETRNIVLNVGDQKALQIELKAGDVNAEVQVLSEAPLISTSPAVSTTIDRAFVQNLPLNGRSFQSLILLTPGVVLVPDNLGAHGAQFSVNGQRTTANYLTVDGVAANIAISGLTGGGGVGQEQSGALFGVSVIGTTNNLISVDSLEEFKIQTSSYEAQYGREPGGQVQFVTKSGGNQFHGTGFEYVRNEAFDARNWFNKKPAPKPPVRQNQFGGTFSGPVFLPRFGEGGKPYWSGRNKTFFFFSYEGQRLQLPKIISGLVPSLRMRQAAAAVFQPILNAFPLPTGAETIRNGQPSGYAPFTGSISIPSTLDATSLRIDQNIGNKLTLFGRYNDSPGNSSGRNLSQLSGYDGRTRTTTLGATIAIAAGLMNEIRFNHSSNKAVGFSKLDNFGGAVPFEESMLMGAYSGPGPKQATFYYMLPGGNVSLSLANSFLKNEQRQLNFVDNLSWTKGAHQLKFGVDYRRLAPILQPNRYSSQNQVRNEASVRNGTLSVFVAQANKEARPLFNNYSFYGQDTWVVSPRLTLDLGLRWELNPAPHDANGTQPVIVCGVEKITTATLCPPNTSFYKTFYGAFAPRVGAAYQLRRTNGRETIVRGGFGVFYDLGSGQATTAFTGFPFRSSKIFQNVAFPVPATIATPPAFPAVQLPLTDIALYGLNPALKLPYTLEWNLAVEQSLGAKQTLTASYVGSAGRRLLTTVTLNQQIGLTGSRPNSSFGDLSYVTNGPSSDYHALQAQYQHRLSHGLQTLLNYTWSHAIDEASEEVAYFPTLARGNASFDIRHNFSAAVTYDLPRISATTSFTRFLRAVVGGWSVSSAIYAMSGRPLDIVAGNVFHPDGSLDTGRPDLILGVPLWIKDPTVPRGQRLNPAAFAYPPPDPTWPGFDNFFARQGTLGRNVVRLPGVYQVNASISRRFALSERLSLQLAADAFNLFNHPTFSDYDYFFYPGTTSLGVPYSTLDSSLGTGGASPLYQLGGPRSMQFSARLRF